MLRVNQSALGACQKTGERMIPEEPQYLMFNVALADQAGWVNMSDPSLFPKDGFEFKLDYVRYYQRPKATSTTCSTEEYPTEDFIRENPTVFDLPNSRDANVTNTDTCGNSTTRGNIDPTCESTLWKPNSHNN